jgi:hypothetical protein
MTAALRRRWAAWVAVVLFFGVVTAWLLWPLPLRAGAVLLHRGDPLHQLWTLRWVQHALAAAPARLVAANVNFPYGAALALNQPMYTNALLTAPVLALSGNPLLAFNGGVILTFVLGGAFTALLAREVTGSWWGGLAAGVVYAFAPVRQAHIYHLNLLSGFWTALVLWGLHRLWAPRMRDTEGIGAADAPPHLHPQAAVPPATKRRRLVLAGLVGVATAAQTLAEFYLAIYLALAVTLFLLWQVATQRGVVRQALPPTLLAGAVALALALPAVLPTARAWGALDLRRPASDHDTYGARLANYAVTDQPLPLRPLLARIGGDSAESNSAELSLYPGALAVLLALAGVFAARRMGRRHAPLYLLLAFAAFVLSLGPTIRLTDTPDGLPSPIYRWLYEHLPGFQGARVPARWALLLQLALAVLAGYTVTWLAALRPARWWRPAAGTSIIALLLLDVAGTPGRGAYRPPLLPEIYRALAAQPPGALLEFPLMNADETLPYRYEYFSTFHWRPIVNSGSSIVPPAYIALRDALGRFPEPQAVALLRALDVRYVVVHREELAGWAAFEARLAGARGLTELARAPNGDRLLRVEPGDTPAVSAARGTGPDGMLLMSAAPRMLDAAHVYELRRPAEIGLERADGGVIRATVELPTWLPGGTVALPWVPPEDVVALRLPTSAGEVRLPITAAPTFGAQTAAPHVTGAPLPERVAPGETLPCRAYGRGPATTGGLVLSVNLVDGRGAVRVKQDRFFDEGFAPPDRWPRAGAEPAPCDLALPTDLPPGRYALEIGLFDPASGQMIPIAGPSGALGPWWTRSVLVTPERASG